MIKRYGQNIEYDARENLISYNGSAHIYDGDGNRVMTEHADDSVSIYISNYYERLIPRIDDFGPVDPPVTRNSGQDYNSYFPIVGNGEGPNFETVPGTSYYYAGTSRIAMKTEQGKYIWIYGDHLGSTSVTADRDGDELSRTKYFAWGTTRYSSGAQATEYGYTGQMQVDDIYYYNARWYDPAIGRFMQADTLVPPHQGTQGFDRYAYVNNNPTIYRDENGHWVTTLVGGIIGAAIGYGVQVYQNVQTGMKFEEALTTNISAEKILAGAAAGAIAGTLLPVVATAISTTGLFTAGTTTVTAACADGDCTNEASATLEGLKTTGEFVSQKIGSTGSIGQKALESIEGYSQVYLATPYGGRFNDRLSDLGTAMEAKVGYQVLTYTIKTQIIKDAFLLQNNPAVQAVEWHFFRSPVTGKVGPSRPLFDFLIENGFKAIIH